MLGPCRCSFRMKCKSLFLKWYSTYQTSTLLWRRWLCWSDVQLTDPPLNIRRCQGLHITDKDMWLLGPYLLCQCVRRGASEGHKSQPKLGQVSLTSHFTLSLLTFIWGFHCRSRLPPKIDFHAIWRCRGSPQKSVHRAGSSLTTSSRKAD